jgi:hypothetical protein
MSNEKYTGTLLELKEEDLDQVSGGVNPQPLPPGIVAEMTVWIPPDPTNCARGNPGPW